MTNSPRQTVRSAVAQRQDDAAEVESVEQRIRAARTWFDQVMPSHKDPDQFIALCIGALRRNKDLMDAAQINPGPFMVAASECARLGLVPGETYHFAAFRNKETRLLDITGIVDYKGEIDMIYRAGGVAAVHGQVVRAADTFVWRPGMELPHHEISANDAGQIGLADEGDRGPLTGVYVYARLVTGGYSEPIVLSRSDVLKHKAIAKTDKFWKGPWEPDMWLKTAFHKLYDRVPHSQEYLAEHMRAMAVPPMPALPAARPVQLHPRPAADVPAAIAHAPHGDGGEPLAGTVVDPPNGAAGPAAASPPAGDTKPPTPEMERVKALKWIHAQFTAAGLGGKGKADHEARRGVASVLGAESPLTPLTITSLADLDAVQAVRAARSLDELITQATDRDQDVRAELLALANAAPAAPVVDDDGHEQ